MMVISPQNALNGADKTRARARGHRDPVWNTPRKTHPAYLVMYRGLEYSRAAAAKSAAGFRTPSNLLAAPRFACAVALTHPLKTQLLYCISNISMVAQAGQPSGWPVSSRTGSANLVWATTQEFRTSSGSVLRNLLEAAKWLRSSSKLILMTPHSACLPGCIMNDSNSTSENTPDSWSICDSCRLLANAITNPKNTDSRTYLCMMMQTQLESLETALAMPVPENRKTLPPMPDDGIFDNTELEPAELCDQCRALNYALIMLSNKMVQEVIAFILCERLEMLRHSLFAPDGEQS
jgi:hypothetical protein